MCDLNLKALGRLKDYSIRFTGLKEGRHEFGFKLDDAFFSNFSNSEIHNAGLTASVDLQKRTNFLELQIRIDGHVRVTCDRCLEEFDLPLSGCNRLYVKFGEKTYEQSDEVTILAANESEIRMGQYFYEYAHLALPYRRVHEMVDGGRCNGEMMEKLEQEGTILKDYDATDPRWDQLKKLL